MTVDNACGVDTGAYLPTDPAVIAEELVRKFETCPPVFVLESGARMVKTQNELLMRRFFMEAFQLSQDSPGSGERFLGGAAVVFSYFATCSQRMRQPSTVITQEAFDELGKQNRLCIVTEEPEDQILTQVIDFVRRADVVTNNFAEFDLPLRDALNNITRQVFLNRPPSHKTDFDNGAAEMNKLFRIQRGLSS